MIITDLLKKYDSKIILHDNGDKTINENILDSASIIKNNSSTFILHSTDEDGLFELIVESPNTVIYNFFDEDGELYMKHSYSDDGVEISN